VLQSAKAANNLAVKQDDEFVRHDLAFRADFTMASISGPERTADDGKPQFSTDGDRETVSPSKVRRQPTGLMGVPDLSLFLNPG